MSRKVEKTESEENEMKGFDTDIPKEFTGKWKLERYETGTYRIISEWNESVVFV